MFYCLAGTAPVHGEIFIGQMNATVRIVKSFNLLSIKMNANFHQFFCLFYILNYFIVGSKFLGLQMTMFVTIYKQELF